MLWCRDAAAVDDDMLSAKVAAELEREYGDAGGDEGDEGGAAGGAAGGAGGGWDNAGDNAGRPRFQFVFYTNPKMNMPSVDHVQVFWRDLRRPHSSLSSLSSALSSVASPCNAGPEPVLLEPVLPEPVLPTDAATFTHGYGMAMVTPARPKVGFSRFSLSPPLLAWLQEDGEFVTGTNTDALRLDLQDGPVHLDKCIDYPHLPHHHYFEGYFHTLAHTSAPTLSLHPRQGFAFQKPAAPTRLRSFVAAFRRLNESWIAPLADTEGAGGEEGEEGAGGAKGGGGDGRGEGGEGGRGGEGKRREGGEAGAEGKEDEEGGKSDNSSDGAACCGECDRPSAPALAVHYCQSCSWHLCSDCILRSRCPGCEKLSAESAMSTKSGEKRAGGEGGSFRINTPDAFRRLVREGHTFGDMALQVRR